MLLSVRGYVAMDRSRLAGEEGLGWMTSMIPTMRDDHEVYAEERKHADALPHRQRDLETAVADLQLGPLASRVHALLDNHLAALPPKIQQDEGDRLWRSPSIAWISASTPLPIRLVPKSPRLDRGKRFAKALRSPRSHAA